MAAMAKMGWNQYVGAIGEAEALRDLLHTGAAVNGLTASDSGWDIHLHLPEQPQNLYGLTAAEAGRKNWRLSGRAAHVQVKHSSKPDSWPKVNIGTARGWVTGSQSGTPTFLLVGQSDESSEKPNWLFVTPKGIHEWLLDRGSLSGDKYSAAQMKGHAFDPRWFGWTLHMWSRYAYVLMAVPHLDELFWATRSYEADEIEMIAQQITATLLAGYLSDTRAVRGDDDLGWWQQPHTNELAAQLLNALIGGFSPDGETAVWSGDVFTGVHEDLFNLADKGMDGWLGHGVSTATYGFEGGGGRDRPIAALQSLIHSIREARMAILECSLFRVEGFRHPIAGLPTPSA